MEKIIEELISTDWCECHIIEKDFSLYYRLTKISNRSYTQGPRLRDVIRDSVFTDNEKTWLQKYFGFIKS